MHFKVRQDHVECQDNHQKYDLILRILHIADLLDQIDAYHLERADFVTAFTNQIS